MPPFLNDVQLLEAMRGLMRLLRALVWLELRPSWAAPWAWAKARP